MAKVAEEKIKMVCPVCKVERDFVRVVEAHVEREQFTMHTVIGAPVRQWVALTEHPTAYCTECKVIIYVGPSAEEVEEDFKRKQEGAKSKENKRYAEQIKRLRFKR